MYEHLFLYKTIINVKYGQNCILTSVFSIFFFFMFMVNKKIKLINVTHVHNVSHYL